MGRPAAMAMATLLSAALGCGDNAGPPTEPIGPPAEATAAAASPLAFRQVSAGDFHTCGVTTDYKAYCWGEATFGELGNGDRFGPIVCGSEGSDGCSGRPIAVLGGVRFQSVSAARWYTCGVATDGRAWCWGDNRSGQLGDGTTTPRLTPVAVIGGHLFRQVSANSGEHTCGLTTDNRIYCWGSNFSGQLGDGTQATRLVPKLVVGGRSWRLVSVGGEHTCALTTDNQAFCWGGNSLGQVGDSSTAPRRLVPVRVATNRSFKQLSSGGLHTCAVTIGARGFCWGDGDMGVLGNGGTSNARWPKPVAGGLNLDRISAGSWQTCAEAAGNKAYCWGRNSDGQLGIGTRSGPSTCDLEACSTRPVAVTGGLSFVQVDVGMLHVCARTAANLAYCWGDSFDGETGTKDEVYYFETAPAPVLGPL